MLSAGARDAARARASVRQRLSARIYGSARAGERKKNREEAAAAKLGEGERRGEICSTVKRDCYTALRSPSVILGTRQLEEEKLPCERISLFYCALFRVPSRKTAAADACAQANTLSSALFPRVSRCEFISKQSDDKDDLRRLGTREYRICVSVSTTTEYKDK